MLCACVDDHDMSVTHVMRGDDHFTNTFRQAILLMALGWTPPTYLHLGLVHGLDGTKMSKRKKSNSIDDLRMLGYLPTAVAQLSH